MHPSQNNTAWQPGARRMIYHTAAALDATLQLWVFAFF